MKDNNNINNNLEKTFINDFIKVLKDKLTKSRIDCIKVNLTKTTNSLPLFFSKLGGYNYPLKDKELDKFLKENKYFFLLQINIKDIIPFFKNFPYKEGILEFYILDNANIDFDNLINNCKVVYIPVVDCNLQTLENQNINLLDNNKVFKDFHISECGLNFSKSFSIPSEETLEFNNILEETSKMLLSLNKLYKNFLYDDSYNLNYIYLSKTISSYRKELGLQTYNDNVVFSQLFGYSKVVQRDFRISNATKYKDYILFLQLESEHDKIMIGDMGVCYFYIKKKDLEKGDFSKILFTWECY